MKFAIIDFGSSGVKVGRALKKFDVEFTYFLNDVKYKQIKDYDGIIFSGSKDSVYDDGQKIDIDILNSSIPLLGICYGMQLTIYMLGGKVQKSETPEWEGVILTQIKDSPLFKDLPKQHKVHMRHNDEVVVLPEGFERIAETDRCYNAAAQNLEKNIFVTQFHPEGTDNDYGDEIIKNFITFCKGK